MPNTITLSIQVNQSGAVQGIQALTREVGELRRESVSAGDILAGVFGGSVLGSAFNTIKSTVSDFFKSTIQQGRELADAQRFLAAAVQETGGSFEDAKRQATAFGRAIGLIPKEAERLFATAKVGLQGTGADADRFLRSAADLAAARGIGPKDLNTIVTQIFNGADEGLGRLFAGKNPSTFFNEYAKAAGRTADSLTDVERRQILVNAVIEAAGQHAGEAASRVDSFGGKLEQLGARSDEAAAKIGSAISRSRGLNEILNRALSGADAATGGDLIDRTVGGLLGALGQVEVGLIRGGTVVANGINELVGFVDKGKVAFESLWVTIEAGSQRAFARVQANAAQLLQNILKLVPGSATALGFVGLDEQAVQGLLAGADASDAAARALAGGAGNLDEKFAAIDARTNKANANLDRMRDQAIAVFDQFGQLDPAKPFEQMGVAIDNTTNKLAALKTQIGTLAEKQFKDLLALSDLGALQRRYAEPGFAGPNLATGAYGQTTDDYSTGAQYATGIYGQRTNDFATGAQFAKGIYGQITDELGSTPGAGKETEEERVRRIFSVADDYLRQFRPATGAVGFDEATGTISGAGGKLSAEAEQALKAAQAQRDKFLYEQLRGIDPSAVRAAGFGGEFESTLSRLGAEARKTVANDQQALTNALGGTTTALESTTTALKASANATLQLAQMIVPDDESAGLLAALKKGTTVTIVDASDRTQATFGGVIAGATTGNPDNR